MLYPLYVHIGDAKHAHGVTFPDFRGCFAAADSWEDLPSAVQEAAQAHFAGNEEPIPEPTPLERLATDPKYVGGVWMLFDIDLSKLRSNAVRLNMRLIDLRDAQRRLPELVEQAARGQPFLIAQAGKARVKVLPLSASDARKVSRIGFLAGEFAVPDDFDRMGAGEIETQFSDRT